MPEVEKTRRKNYPAHEAAIIGLYATISALEELIDAICEDDSDDDDFGLLCDARGALYMCNSNLSALECQAVPFLEMNRRTLEEMRESGISITPRIARQLCGDAGADLADAATVGAVPEAKSDPEAVVLPAANPAPSVQDKFRWQWET